MHKTIQLFLFVLFTATFLLETQAQQQLTDGSYAFRTRILYKNANRLKIRKSDFGIKTNGSANGSEDKIRVEVHSLELFNFQTPANASLIYGIEADGNTNGRYQNQAYGLGEQRIRWYCFRLKNGDIDQSFDHCYHYDKYSNDIKAFKKAMNVHADISRKSITSATPTLGGGFGFYKMKNIEFDVLIQIHLLGATQLSDLQEIKIPGLGVITQQDLASLNNIVIVINENEDTQKIYQYGGNSNKPVIDALMGDKITFKVKSPSNRKPTIEGLPDTWIAHFGKESIFMSSKSILPGGYKPWVPIEAFPHGINVRTYPEGWEEKYPDWQLDSETTTWKLDWTLQRAMDANLKYDYNGNGKLEEDEYVSYWRKYPDEDAPYYTQEGKVNPETNARNGQDIGIIMGVLSGLNGKFKDDYKGPSNEYLALVDGDDWFTTEFPAVNHTKASRRYDQVVPTTENGNPLPYVITWYQKFKHINDPTVANLTYDYRYNGYEIWEGLNENNPESSETTRVSKAPGLIRVVFGEDFANDIEIKINVASPLINQKFYAIHGDRILTREDKTGNYSVNEPNTTSTGTLEMKFRSKHFGKSINNQDQLLTQENNMTVGDFTIHNPWTYFNDLSVWYKRNENSEPVIIAGKDLWLILATHIRCDQFENINNSRVNRIEEQIREKRKKKTTILQHLNLGYKTQKTQEVFHIPEGTELTFKLFTGYRSPYKFPTGANSWTVSSRRLLMRDEVSALEDIITWKIEKINPANSEVVEFTNLSDTGWDLKHRFNQPGYYHLKPLVSGFERTSFLINVTSWNGNEKAKIATRELTQKEKQWLSLTDNEASNLRLFRVKDLKSEYAWNDMRVRARIKEDGTAVIDRYGPFNDYADHYLVEVEGNPYAKNEKVTNFINGIEGQYKFDKAVWANHVSPTDKLKDFDNLTVTNATEDQLTNYFSQSEKENHWSAYIPWGTVSKYHGFIPRDQGKRIYKISNLKTKILNNESSPNEKINPVSSLITDDDMLKYEFLLNLKYNRWILVPATTSSVTFKHGTTQDLIATYPTGTSGGQSRANLDKTATYTQKEPISIYPNPTEGNTRISLGDVFTNTKEKITIRIYNLYEKELYKKVLQEGATTFYVNLKAKGFTPGIYFITVTSGNKRHESKIIVK